jgi:hypothetical protein
MYLMLPTEIWKHIALQYTVDGEVSPAVYVRLSLVSRMFAMDIPMLQEYYLQKYVTNDRIEYKLPNGNYHSPAYGKLPAVSLANNVCQEWYVDGKRHRDGGLPAVVYTYSVQYWYVNDKPHRDGGLPAVIYADGTQEWYVDGKRRRDGDLPAIVRASGDQEWYKNGKRHRDGGLPAVIWTNGEQYWYVDGIRN